MTLSMPHSVSAVCAISTLYLSLAAAVAQTNSPIPPDGQLTTPYRVEIVASRLQVPWSVVFTPDGRTFFSERPGWVRVIENGRVLPEPALLLKDVAPSVKMGLLGLAVDPDFSTNHFLYLGYDYDIGKENYRLRVVRFRESDNRLIEPHTLVENIPAFRNHTGCRLRFGPDGCLYITTGDANQPELAQRLDSLAGKILRLNPDGSIPHDNPFIDRAGAFGAIWSFGHRNPQGLDFQPGTGALIAAEHGPDHGDEVNLITKGENYGWPVIHHRLRHDGMQNPMLEFTPAIAPSGASFYRGKAFPELTGKLLAGCLRGEGILVIGFEGTNAVTCARLLHFKYGRIRDVTEGPDGFVYFTTSQFDPPEGTPKVDYDLILRLVPQSVPSTGAALAAEVQDTRLRELAINPATTNAAELVQVYCAACHGPGLTGGMQRTLLHGGWQFATDDQSMRKVINEGLPNKGMPAFGAALKSEQVGALIRYIRENQTTAPAPVQQTPPRPQGANPFE